MRLPFFLYNDNSKFPAEFRRKTPNGGFCVSTSNQQIVFAISDTGGGHRSGAAAIIAALENSSDTSCPIIDLLRLTEFPLLRQAPEIYGYCSRNHLWLNDFFFRRTNSISRINALTKMVFFHSGRRIVDELIRLRPTAVVAVHPLVIGLLRLARERTGASWPIITVVTDLVTIHASWATPGADLYLGPTQEACHSLRRHGIPAKKIVHTGFPVHPKFLLPGLTQTQVRQELGLSPDKFTVLFTGGGVGAGNMAEWITTLRDNCGDKEILIVTGNNHSLYDDLNREHSHNSSIKIYGFVDNMEKLMAASNIIVSKAGPGTIMEGVAIGRPLIITEAVGIQESGNIDFIRKKNLGWYCPTPEEACMIINQMSDSSAPLFACGDRPADTAGAELIAQTILEFADNPGQNPLDTYDPGVIRGA